MLNELDDAKRLLAEGRAAEALSRLRRPLRAQPRQRPVPQPARHGPAGDAATSPAPCAPCAKRAT